MIRKNSQAYLLLLHAKVHAVVLDEGIVFTERTRVDQELDTLTSSELTLLIVDQDEGRVTDGNKERKEEWVRIQISLSSFSSDFDS